MEKSFVVKILFLIREKISFVNEKRKNKMNFKEKTKRDRRDRESTYKPMFSE